MRKTDNHIIIESEERHPSGVHPVISGTYTIKTDEMYSLFEYMTTVIKLGLDGVIIYGSAYAGKSFAMTEMIKWFKYENPDYQLFKFTMSGKDYQFKEFYQYISERIGCSLPRSSNSNKIIEHLINSLAIMARRSGNKIVLIIDEAEGLNINHYKMLKYLYNRLAELQIKLVTFLVGTEALLNSRDVFLRSGSVGEQIIRRFMQGKYRFHGIMDESQMEYVLSNYDSIEYSGKTFTEYFFPKAWKNGMRLSDLSGDIISSMLESSGLSVLPEVPMGYFTKLINSLFLMYGTDTTFNDQSGKSFRKEWMTKSEIMRALRVINIDEKLVELSVKANSDIR